MIKKTVFALGITLLAFGLCRAPRAALAEAPPKRIVSFNLCADQLLLALGGPVADRGSFPLCNQRRAVGHA